MGHRRMLTPEEREQRAELITKLYTAGCNARAISIYLAVSHGLVVGVLERQGVPRRPRGRPKEAGKVVVSPVEVMGADYVPPYLAESEIGPFKARVEAYDTLYAKLPGSGRSIWTSAGASREIEKVSAERWPEPDPAAQPQISLSFDPPVVAAAPLAPEPAAMVGTMTASTVADVVAARFDQLELEEDSETAVEPAPELHQPALEEQIFPRELSNADLIAAELSETPDNPDEDEQIAY